MKMVKSIELFSESVGAFCLNIPMPEGSIIKGVSTGVNAKGEKAAFLTVFIPNTAAPIVGKHIHILPVGNDFYADHVELVGVAVFENGFQKSEGRIEIAVFEVIDGDWGYNSAEYIEKHGAGGSIANAMLNLLLGGKDMEISSEDFDTSGYDNEFGKQIKQDSRAQNDDESYGSSTDENNDSPNDLPIDENDFRKRFGL